MVRDVVVLVAVLPGPGGQRALSPAPTGCTALQMPWLVECGTELWNPAFLNSSGMKVAVGWPAWPVAASGVGELVVGRKPPSNQPQDRPAALSWSPMFVPLMATASRVEQSSQYGWASLVSEKPPWPSAVRSAFGLGGGRDRRVVGGVRHVDAAGVAGRPG